MPLTEAPQKAPVYYSGVLILPAWCSWGHTPGMDNGVSLGDNVKVGYLSLPSLGWIQSRFSSSFPRAGPPQFVCPVGLLSSSGKAFPLLAVHCGQAWWQPGMAENEQCLLVSEQTDPAKVH